MIDQILRKPWKTLYTQFPLLQNERLERSWARISVAFSEQNEAKTQENETLFTFS